MIQLTKPFFQNVNNKKTLKSEVEQAVLDLSLLDQPRGTKEAYLSSYHLFCTYFVYVQDIGRYPSWLTRTFCNEKYPK
jgi:hypothetical protein